jgi:hypothetical protein
MSTITREEVPGEDLIIIRKGKRGKKKGESQATSDSPPQTQRKAISNSESEISNLCAVFRVCGGESLAA